MIPLRLTKSFNSILQLLQKPGFYNFHGLNLRLQQFDQTHRQGDSESDIGHRSPDRQLEHFCLLRDEVSFSGRLECAEASPGGRLSGSRHKNGGLLGFIVGDIRDFPQDPVDVYAAHGRRLSLSLQSVHRPSLARFHAVVKKFRTWRIVANMAGKRAFGG